MKIIGIHGYLDNLNSMLPLAEKLIDRHPDYEIYIYDRGGHGFSSHLPKGFEYSGAQNLQDLRTIIQTLGWNKEKFSIIGHSYGAILGTLYAASYPEEVLFLVAIDALPRIETSPNKFFKLHASRIDSSLKFHNMPPRTFDTVLTFEKALEVTKSTRLDITDEAAKLLTERSVRRDAENKLHFTRDEALKILPLVPFTGDIIRSGIIGIKASVLFIGSANPQWPRDQKPFDIFKEHNPNFEMTLIDGPHHLHMTHVDEVLDRIEQYFNKYLQQSSTINSQL